jgi:putative DNA primase/helicase
MKTPELVRGKWTGTLKLLGIPDSFLTGKHGPCPMCGGSDRFRYDNKDGRGTFYCSQCGAGDGFKLIMQYFNWDFKTAAREIEQKIGHVAAEPPKREMDENQRVDMLNRLWTGASPLTGDDMASRYLAGRDAVPGRAPDCLRFHERCPVPGDGGFLPAMLAVVAGPDGNPTNIHRTFLGSQGKADIESPRAMMPGTLPPGSAVRLYPLRGERLGVAEGIETAIRAAKRFQVPVWAALNSTMLEKWLPPAGIGEVLVFGDNDHAFGGQASAYALAHRLVVRNRVKAQVHIPQTPGMDWGDIDAA